MPSRQGEWNLIRAPTVDIDAHDFSACPYRDCLAVGKPGKSGVICALPQKISLPIPVQSIKHRYLGACRKIVREQHCLIFDPADKGHFTAVRRHGRSHGATKTAHHGFDLAGFKTFPTNGKILVVGIHIYSGRMRRGHFLDEVQELTIR